MDRIEKAEAEVALIPSTLHETKAVRRRPILQNVKRRRQSTIAILIASACVLVFFLFGSKCVSTGDRWRWSESWRTTYDEDTLKGSKYLLGVGKADITG